MLRAFLNVVGDKRSSE